jgi:prophage regulatory protein
MSDKPAFTGPRLLRLPAVLAFSGYGRTQLFEAIKRHEFPRPIKLTPSGRAIAWDSAELDGWKKARKAARDRRAA